jgi:hypothetical protein
VTRLFRKTSKLRRYFSRDATKLLPVVLETVRAKQSEKENVIVSREPGEQAAGPDLLTELKRGLAAHGRRRSDRAGTVEHRPRRCTAPRGASKRPFPRIIIKVVERADELI